MENLKILPFFFMKKPALKYSRENFQYLLLWRYMILMCFKRTLELQMTRKCVTYRLLITILQMVRNRNASLYSIVLIGTQKRNFMFNNITLIAVNHAQISFEWPFN